MDFYEELGVARSASTEEIRLAYRALVRLLHPDQCTEERLRQLAELQMKRLNQMVAVLTTPEERWRYDARLELQDMAAASARQPQPDAAHVPPAAPRRPGRDRGAWIWLAAAAIGVAVPIWYLAESAPDPHPALLQELEEARREVRQLRRERKNAPPPPATAAASFGASPFTGNWFYVPKTPQAHSAGRYLPEYIELRLRQEGSRIRGRYRGRYKVKDQAISPEVAFEFEGPAGASPLTVPWRGPGGASGDIALKLVAGDFLEVHWRVYRLGYELGLTSGVAVLFREQERQTP